MESVITTIQWFGVFAAGLVVRAAIAVAVVALLAIPITLLLLAARSGHRAWLRLRGVSAGDGYRWDSRAYYAPTHTWLRRVGRDMRVGLDDLAQRLLIGSSAIELPRPGRTVRAGEAVGAVRCGDKEAAIIAPVSGTITGVNEAVVRDPSLIHGDPYGRGWLYRVVPTELSMAQLRQGPIARAWLHDESGRLVRFLESELGVAAADGGEIVSPAPSLLTPEQWARLARAFLSSH
jgi:glycine cleavage system H lipoate-binding protein